MLTDILGLTAAGVDELLLKTIADADRPLQIHQLGFDVSNPARHRRAAESLDRLHISDKIERIGAGPYAPYRIVQKAVASSHGKRPYSKFRDANGLIVGSQIQRVHLWLLKAQEPVAAQQAATALNLSMSQAKSCLKSLKALDLASLTGQANTARWTARTLVSSQPAAGTPPADKATESNIGASAGVAPPDGISADVTAPTGGRKPLSLETIGDLEQKIGFHQQAAEAEVPAPAPAPTLSGVVNGSQISAAEFALWSDGCLEITTPNVSLVFSKDVTRQFIDYLDRVCAINHH